MSKTTEEEARVARELAAALGIDVCATRLTLGVWGHTDGHCLLPSGWHLVIEVESSQRHPCTNVAKLWPWLEENAHERALLVHVFFTGSNGTSRSRGLDRSRDRVGQWIAARMESELRGRFRYHRLVDLAPAALTELRAIATDIPFSSAPAP